MLPLPPEHAEESGDAHGALAATRVWLRDPTRSPEERRAFEAYTRELTRLYFHWLGFAIAGAALLWWPTDGIIYADDPELRATFGRYRALIITMNVCMAVALPRVRALHPWAHAVAISACLLNLTMSGWFMGEVGRGDPSWLAYGYIMPLFAILLLIPLKARIAATASFTGTLCGAWLLHPETQLSSPTSLGVMSYMGFAALLSIGIGHGFYVLVRQAFHLRRRVERQREALAELAARLEQRVSEQTRDLREMHRRAQTLRAEQRVELARDLHDGLGQELTSLRLLVGIGQQLSPQSGAEDVFAELDGQVARVQQSLRGVLRALRPQKLDALGLVEALRELIGELERRSGLVIRFEPAPDLPEPLPSEHSLTLYRIAQEGLNNAIRHARASQITLRLRAPGPALELEVEDDGVGLAPERLGAGLGTRGVRERAEALGGEARWTRDGGTRLHVTLPLPEPA